MIFLLKILKRDPVAPYNWIELTPRVGQVILWFFIFLVMAIAELNRYTELEVWYTEVKKGRAITGFVLHWSTGEKVSGATDGQMNMLRMIHDSIMKDMMTYLALKDEKILYKHELIYLP